MWNISDILNKFAEGVKNKTYKKIPYDIWRELCSYGEDYGTIEVELSFANPYEEDRTRVFLKNQKGQDLYSSYITDGAFGTYLFDLYQKQWHKEMVRTTCSDMKESIKTSCEKMKESFSQLAATANSTAAELTISSEQLATAASLDGAFVYAGTSTGRSFYDSGPATLEVKDSYFKVDGKTITEMIEEIVNRHNKEEEKENMDLFKNFDFGSCENDKVKVSMYGIAVQNPTGTWVSYDQKNSTVVDVDILNFNGKYLYKMPVAIKDVTTGDVIIHNRKPMFVVQVDGEGKLLVIDPAAGEEKIILPTTNMFGFNFVTKIVNLFGNCFGSVSADQPFGNMLPLMMLADGGKTDDVLPLMFLMNGGGNFDMSNPMMLYFLMKDGKSNDMLPLMFLSNGTSVAFGKHECHCNCDHKD